MTTIEASIKLFDWFSSSDYFNYPHDCQKLLGVFENDYDFLPIKTALSNLQESKIISSELDKGNTIYFLNKKLNQVEQTVELNYSVALDVANTINWFCNEIVKDESAVCDPSSITQKDIYNLTYIINFLKTLDKTPET